MVLASHYLPRNANRASTVPEELSFSVWRQMGSGCRSGRFSEGQPEHIAAGLDLGASYVTGLLRFGPGRDADGAWATLMWRQARGTIWHACPLGGGPLTPYGASVRFRTFAATQSSP